MSIEIHANGPDPRSAQMSESPNMSAIPATPAVARPRHSAALIVAATLAFVAAALTVGALFPDYWDAPRVSLFDQTGPLAQNVVFAAALMVGGGLLLGKRSAPTGGALLAVVVAIGLQPRVVDTVRLGESTGPRAGTGYALLTAGFVLALVATVISAFVVLRPRDWALRGGARPLTVLAALAGFGAAVGYGMTPFSLDGVRNAIGFGSPLGPLSRQLWAALLVVVLLTVVPPAAVAVGRRIGSGLALGLLFAIGGIAAFRVGEIYGTIGGRDTGFSGAEGTWTFLAAGGAALIMTFAGLAGGSRSAPAADSFPPQSVAPPPPVAATPVAPADEPSEPVVVVPDATAGDESSSDESSSDESSSDESSSNEATPDAPAQSRVDPMRSADESTTTWNADSSTDAGPQE
jgi:hypothetical protein